jgi:hypothetical protein
MSSSRIILTSLKIPLTAISKRIHNTVAQPISQIVIPSISTNIEISNLSQNSSKFSASFFRDGKAYPVGRVLSPEELEKFKATAVPREQIREALEMAAENHRRSIYG